MDLENPHCRFRNFFFVTLVRRVTSLLYESGLGLGFVDLAFFFVRRVIRVTRLLHGSGLGLGF